jgi:hypothetical protein
MYSHCHQQLTEVALDVFGGMEQQAEDRRRKLLAAHRPVFGERALVGGAKLMQRLYHTITESLHQWVSGHSGSRRTAFCPKLGHLQRGKLLPFGIGEKSVNHSAHVLQMKTNGRDASWTRPQLVGGESMEQLLHLVRGLHQGVRYRLKLRRYARYGSAEPGLRPGTCHFVRSGNELRSMCTEF